jgi:hypothetical protein
MRYIIEESEPFSALFSIYLLVATPKIGRQRSGQPVGRLDCVTSWCGTRSQNLILDYARFIAVLETIDQLMATMT